MSSESPFGERRSIDIAARSFIESRMVSGTVQGLVAERAFDHYQEGLLQYAFIRVGEKARDLLGELGAESSVEHDGPRDRSPRAQLYSRMRALITTLTPSPLAAEAPQWWSPPLEPLREQLVALRRGIRPELAELVELRFTHRLSEAEVSAVVGHPEKQVRASLVESLRIAERVTRGGPATRRQAVEDVLGEAFLLDPRRLPAVERRERTPVLSLGTVVAHRYEILELLGGGAFSDVYQARDREVLDHIVALKILRTPSPDKGSARRAMRELRLIASVFHPSLVQLKDHGWHEQRLWFVMPFYRGETLSTRLRRGPLGRKEAREVFEPLAEALATMHRAGILHQDVKPENVLLANLNPLSEPGADEPRRILPVLIDLGVAAKDAELILAGTPLYLAPEVAARFSAVPDPPLVGPKADVFSLALVLRNALAPGSAESVVGSVDRFVALRAAGVSELTARDSRSLSDLLPFLRRWLAFSPDDRPTAEELRRELATLTRPAERAERRAALLRWAVPTSVALLTGFAAVVSRLSQEASLQRVEAENARERAAEASQQVESISESLNLQKARREQLEQDVSRLEERYERSRMTREQLAQHLAHTEGNLRLLEERQTQQTQRAQAQAEAMSWLKRALAEATLDLQTAKVRRDELQQQASQLRRALDERTKQAEDATRLRADLVAATRASELADKLNRELYERVQRLEAELAESRRRTGLGYREQAARGAR